MDLFIKSLAAHIASTAPPHPGLSRNAYGRLMRAGYYSRTQRRHLDLDRLREDIASGAIWRRAGVGAGTVREACELLEREAARAVDL